MPLKRRRACAALAAMYAAAAALSAISFAPARTAAQNPPVPVMGGLNQPLFRRGDLVFIGSSLAAIAITTRFDEKFAISAQQPGGARQRFHRLTALGSTVGDVYPVEFVLGMWAGGFVAHQRNLETLGRESAEALLLSGVATQIMKGVIGRERPSSAAGHADVYKFGKGFGNNAFSSMPSGHTTVAFSIATVMAVGTANQSPMVHYTVSTIAYTVATSVGLSRLYDNDHWASDVLGGAMVGITSGLVAIRFDRRVGGRPRRSSVGSLLDHLSIAPAPKGGIALGYSSR